MGIDGGAVPPFGGENVDIIDLKSREVFSNEGRGVAALVEEANLKIRQVGLEPGKEVPVHTADAPVTLQVIRGEGVFSAGEESVRMGPGKLLRIPEGASMGIRNESTNPLVFLVIKTPLTAGPVRDSALAGKPGTFVNLIDFAPLKPEKEEPFRDWFSRSSEVFAKHSGFISRTLLGPIEGGSRYAAVVEHESKETFMDMHLSDDRIELFRQVEPLVLGPSTPHFYESLLSYRK
jgi:quercetin dioxygenase-like cupin family protein/heme-degrading monooxygenase HmoA